MPQSPWMEEGGMKEAQSVFEQYRAFLVESSSSKRVYDSTKEVGRCGVPRAMGTARLQHLN